MRMLAMIGLLGVVSLATGCATVRGDKQKVKIETEPSGASLLVDGKEKFTTPAEVTLKRKDNHSIEISKEGYRPIKFNLEAQWDGASMTDVALPGGSALMGLSVATGSDKSFNSLAKITLEKASSANPTVNELFEHRGKLYIKSEYDRIVKEETTDKTRFMGTPTD